MYVYRNSNTGDFAEYTQRSVRLDHLPNWQLIEAPEEPEPEPEPVTAPAAASHPARPLESDTKAAWVAYAVARGMKPGDAKSLSKAALIAEFGEDNTNGED